MKALRAILKRQWHLFEKTIEARQRKSILYKDPVKAWMEQRVDDTFVNPEDVPTKNMVYNSYHEFAWNI